MTETLITGYLGWGLAAARPVTPATPTNALSVYYATDTGALSLWHGSWSVLGTLSTANFASLNLSTLPTADPGGGMPWLNGGVMQVGP